MKTSEDINELAEALAKAQGEIQNPNKGTDNEFFKSKYADLAAVLDVVRGPFSENGLSIIQSPVITDKGALGVETMVAHRSGQWIRGEVSLPLQTKRNIAQDAGSLITYLRRYCLAGFAGVFQEDNDGNLGASKSENSGEVVDLNPKFSKQEIDEFGTEMRQAMEHGDFMKVGRSLINPELTDLWQAANQGTPNKGGGQFTSKQKALQSEMVKQFKEQVQEWANEAVSAASEGYTDAVMEIVGDIDPAEKAMFWSLLNEDTKALITKEKAAA